MKTATFTLKNGTFVKITFRTINNVRHYEIVCSDSSMNDSGLAEKGQKFATFCTKTIKKFEWQEVLKNKPYMAASFPC